MDMNTPIYSAQPCPYCRREIRFYGSQCSNTDDGELHTCAFKSLVPTYRGPMYVDGDFFHTDLPLAPKLEGDTPAYG